MKPWIAVGALTILLVAGGAMFYWRWRGSGPANHAADCDAWFADVTAEAGVEFIHDAGDLSKYQLPQIHGSGVALFDFDGDGLLDIYLLTHGGPGSRSINRLFKNLGSGVFQDVTVGSGLGIAGYCTGVAIGDVNNDGHPDVLVTQYGGIKLFLNKGDGTFADVTDAAGLRDPLWATSASFVDYDKDGWLDLVVVNYLDNDPSWVCRAATGAKEYCGPNAFPGTVTRLFHNLCGTSKEPVRFRDVTVQAGLAKAPGAGLGVYCADFDGDGWPDILVANDAQPNRLWMNRHDGTFVDEALLRGIAVNAGGQPQAGMGVAVGDVDGDGLFDVYVAHLATEHNTLWTQGPGRGQFRDRTATMGLLTSDWRGTGFGTLMGDFNHDGWLDIAVVNGAVARGNPTPTANPALGVHLMPYGECNQLFHNEGQGKFRDISQLNHSFCGAANVARGLAAGDLDGDGALDLVVTQVAGHARIFRNVAPRRGHWLMVRALDPHLKRDAYGAEVTVSAGKRRWLRIVNPGGSYQSSSDPRVHFGLGEVDSVDAIHIRWPDGRAEAFDGGRVDRVLVLQRGQGEKVRPADSEAGVP